MTTGIAILIGFLLGLTFFLIVEAMDYYLTPKVKTDMEKRKKEMLDEIEDWYKDCDRDYVRYDDQPSDVRDPFMKFNVEPKTESDKAALSISQELEAAMFNPEPPKILGLNQQIDDALKDLDYELGKLDTVRYSDTDIPFDYDLYHTIGEPGTLVRKTKKKTKKTKTAKKKVLVKKPVKKTTVKSKGKKTKRG
jgi:hypothetical protein